MHRGGIKKNTNVPVLQYSTAAVESFINCLPLLGSFSMRCFCLQILRFPSVHSLRGCPWMLAMLYLRSTRTCYIMNAMLIFNYLFLHCFNKYFILRTFVAETHFFPKALRSWRFLFCISPSSRTEGLSDLVSDSPWIVRGFPTPYKYMWKTNAGFLLWELVASPGLIMKSPTV